MGGYTIADFPKGEEYWMVTWLGPVDRYEGDYRVAIDFVAIDYDLYQYNPNALTFIKRIDGRPHRASARCIGIDFLAFAEVGSVWQHQRLVISPSQHEPGLDQLTITIKSAQDGKLSLVNELIECPFKYHPFAMSKGHHRSPVWVVSADNFSVSGSKQYEAILIPPFELIRFYFCGSGYFLRQLLAGGLANDEIFIRSLTRYDSTTGEAFVKLRKDLYNSDAQYVGRVALDKVAYKSASDIGNRLMQDHWNGSPRFLTATFPFAGMTKLTVVGKRVQLAEDTKRWGFLVYSIKRCTAQFPFNKLWFNRDNDSRKTDNALSEQWARTAWRRVPPIPAENDVIDSTGSPNPAISQVPIARPVTGKFEHHPAVEQVEKEQQQKEIIGRQPTWYSKVDRYSTSHDLSEMSNAAPSSVETREESLSIDYTALETIVDHLRQARVDCAYLHQPSDWSARTTLTDFPFPKGDLTDKSFQKWRLVQVADHEKTGRKRARRITVIRLTRNGMSYYLIECEARAHERFSRVLIYQPGQPSLNPVLLNEVIKLLAASRGVWRRCDLKTLRIAKRSFDHLANDTPSAVVKRLLNYIDYALCV